MLGDQELMAFVATAKPAEALAFYRDVLGLALVYEDPFAIVFKTPNATLRVQKTGQHQPLPYTSLGWKVGDINATVARLAAQNVPAERFAGLEQSDAGVWTSPSGAKIAWFKDPDGNVLSLTE
jgi:catechol 2,3-dioxygenase-like lactoylglutathione lyase family enzyme